MPWKKGFLVAGIVVFLLSCNRMIVLADGPFRGKVVDAETGEPIEGAVVVAVWYRAQGHAAGETSEFEEAKEALTDKHGEFTIPAYSSLFLKPFSRLKPPEILLFKPGYGHYPWYQVSPRKDLDKAFQPYTVVELSKLTTREERRLKMPSYPGAKVPTEKIPNFIRLINIERMELGLAPLYLKRDKD